MFHRHRRRFVLPRALLGALVVTGLMVGTDVTATAGERAATATQGCGSPGHLDPRTFPTHVRVTNTWLPMVPGAHWVTSGSVSGSRHRVVTTVTDLTKVVKGVQTIVLLDEDFDGNTLSEAELAFFAQDRHHTEWALGEYPEEYDNGVFSGAPSTWISGLDRARAGIAMLGHPRLGTPAYVQGSASTIQFLDCGRVFATNQRTCVPTGCYGHVLVIDEWGPLDPAGGHQRKYYAPGVGLVRVGAVGGDSPEVLDLTSTTHLCPAELTKVRNTALALDRHGYEISPHVYGKTPHAVRTLRAPHC